MKITDLNNYTVTSPARKIPQDEPSSQGNNTDNRFLGGTQDVLNTVFGGEKIGEAIGTQIAKFTPGGRELRRQVREGEITEEQAGDTLKGPSFKEVAGDVGRTALTFAPVGRAASLLGKAGQAVGLGSRAAGITGNVVAGGATGAAFDVAEDVAEGREVGLGAGFTLGAGIPAASPILGALTRASGRVAGRIASETTGVLTGTSQETIEAAYNAARKGGKELDTFTEGLRGRTTPEQLVNNVRESVDVVKQARGNLFAETLAELGDTSVATQPAKDRFRETLTKFKIQISDTGELVFNNSELRTVPAAQSKIQQAWDEVRRMPEVVDINNLDTTRQAVKAIKLIASDDASANKANAIVEDAVRSVRKAGEQVDGYGTMLDNFEETSEFLNELNRGLSTGDKTTIDQAYRRLATTLKTNNEQRKALLEELDQATDGALLSDISGQQLSELYPRGLFRQILAGSASLSAISGAVSPALLPSLIFASPRVVGEMVRTLGITGKKAELFLEAVEDARALFTKVGAGVGAEMDDSGENTPQ